MRGVTALAIPVDHMDAIVRAAAGSPGEEVVFLLFGRVEGERAIVRRVVRADARVDRCSFEVDPSFLARELSAADLRGEELVGLAHSHPGPPEPSAADAAGMTNLPVIWLIVGSSGAPRAWIPSGDGPREVRLLPAGPGGSSAGGPGAHPYNGPPAPG